MSEPTGGVPVAEGAGEPLSFGQQRMWFHEQMDPGTAAYGVPLLFWLRGPVDAVRLAACFEALAARHDTLRTAFVRRAGLPVAIVLPTVPPFVRREDVSGAPETARAEAERLVRLTVLAPFALDAAPLLRVLLVKVGPDEHALLLHAHNLVVDGASFEVLLAELGALYARPGAGLPLSFETPAASYAAYAGAQTALLDEALRDAQLVHWRDRLASPLPVLELPGDKPRPPLPSLRGASLRLPFGSALRPLALDLAARQGTTELAVLEAAFAAFLHRVTGLEDVCVGTSITPELPPRPAHAVGFHGNTVVLRSRPTRKETFRDLVSRMGTTVDEAMANGLVPIDKVVLALGLERRAGSPPPFGVMLDLLASPRDLLVLPGVDVSLGDVHTGTAKVELLVEVHHHENEYELVVEYATDLFGEARVRSLLGAFATLGEDLLRHPDRHLGAGALLDDAETSRIVGAINETAVAFEPAHGIGATAEATAAADPSRVAIVQGDHRVTYRELEARAFDLARALVAMGVGPGALVGVCLERTPAIVVALLGVLKAGAAYVPIDPRYPDERVDYMLTDSGARVVVTEAAHEERAAKSGATPLLLDPAGRLPEGTPQGPADPPGASGDACAYVIYTSGSTGKPKGVRVPHGAFRNFLTSMAREPGLGPKDRLLAVTTISFDIAGLEIFLPLAVGATLVLATPEQTADGEALRALVDDEGITFLQATPMTFRLLLEAGMSAPDRLRALCGGEALPPALVTELLPRVKELWNMYGPTETTVWSTCERVFSPERIVIGRPIANTRVYVLDGDRQPLPMGVPGELYIGGVGVALDYLGRPELTAERFVPDPFAGTSGARMYRTGDVVRLREDFALEYIGRNDHQVKLRGYRIELGEIEAALGRHPAVRQAVAAVKADGGRDPRLVAYVVFAKGEATASELRKHLRAELPEYMVPQLFVPLHALPLTNNGKVDRKALPDPFAASVAGADREHVPPRTDTERWLADVFREVLKVEKVGLHDNFFELGGHSLLSMQALHLIEIRTGVRLNPRSLVFDNLEQVAAACGASSALPSQIPPAPRTSDVPPRPSNAPSRPPSAAPPPGSTPPLARPSSTPPRSPSEPPPSLAGKVFGALKRRVLGS